MKRNMDLIRSLLLELEDVSPLCETWSPSGYGISLEKDAEINEHLNLLFEGGYINGVPLETSGGLVFENIRITWSGHELISSIKDPKIWKMLKEKLLSTSISYTIPLLMEQSQKIIQQLFDQ